MGYYGAIWNRLLRCMDRQEAFVTTILCSNLGCSSVRFVDAPEICASWSHEPAASLLIDHFDRCPLTCVSASNISALLHQPASLWTDPHDWTSMLQSLSRQLGCSCACLPVHYYSRGLGQDKAASKGLQIPG